MVTTLFERLKSALEAGVIDDDLRGDMAMKCIELVGSSPYKMGLSSSSIIDASAHAFELFLDKWKTLVDGSRSETEFLNKLRAICSSACHQQKRVTWRGGPTDLPMGGRIGVDYPDSWDWNT
jgi:hypothetical protein